MKWSCVITVVFRTKTNCEIIICNLFPLCWYLQLSLITLLTYCYLCDKIIYYYYNLLQTYHIYTFVKFILQFPRPYSVLFPKYRCIMNLCIPYNIIVFLYSMIFDYKICTFVLVYNVYRWYFVCYVSKIYSSKCFIAIDCLFYLL